MRVAVPPTDAGIEAWLNEGLNLERHPDGREFKLDRLRAVMPHLPTPPIPCTVTGTKGKGSTVRLIEMGLLAAGRSTVAFTSPHLHRITERWRINGKPASPALIAEHCAQVIQAEAAAGLRLTYFERCFGIAVCIAAPIADCRFIVEVGLGGRLDCANVLDAAVVVCTHLSKDHCQFLGPTVQHIAKEKLALCRPNKWLIVAPQSAEGAAAVQAVRPTTTRCELIQRAREPFALSLLGDHQQDNASTALAAIRHFDPQVNEADVRRGMHAATLGGRCQLIELSGRRILIDGAHNAVSFAATMAVAERCLRPGWQAIIGMASDKETADMLPYVPAGVRVLRCGYDSPRARTQDQWPPVAQSWPWHNRVAQALAQVPSTVDICVTGSFYLAGECFASLGNPDPIPG